MANEGLIALGIAGVALYAIASKTTLPPPEPPNTNGEAPMTVRLNMKSYGNHDTLSKSNLLGTVPYDQRILYIKPEMCIDNPAHGLYGEMDHQKGYPYSELTYLLQPSMIKQYHAAGIRVIGYVTCGYEGAGGDDHYTKYWYQLSTLKMLVYNMIMLDGVNGIFVDECSEQPTTTQKAYHQELANYIHSFVSAYYPFIAWGNTGVDSFNGDFYFNTAKYDYMQSSESWVGQILSPTQQTYGSRISVTGFKSTYTAQKAYDLTIDAWSKGLAYCYINNVEYTSIAPWFEDYANMLVGAAPPPPPPIWIPGGILNIMVSVLGEGTTIPVPGTYQVQKGTSAIVEAIPRAGYKFQKWIINSTNKTSKSASATIYNDSTLVAVFVPEVITIQITVA